MSMPFLLPLRRPLPLILGFSSAIAASTAHNLDSRPLRLDAPAVPRSEIPRSYAQDAKVPIWKDGSVNPKAYGQISSGSMLGIAFGGVISRLSRPLAILIGLAVLGIQYLASKGINVVPRERLQRYVKGINLRSALEDNVAFKFSFGTTFLLAAFAEF